MPLGSKTKHLLHAVILGVLLLVEAAVAAPQAAYPGDVWLYPSPQVSGWSAEK